MTSLTFLEIRRREIWFGAPKAIGVDLLSDFWVRFEELSVLVWMRPDASRRIGLGINLSRWMKISIQ